MTNPVPQPQLQVPASLEAEQALLGAILLEPAAFLHIATFLNGDDFYLKRHEYIWTALSRLHERSDTIDYVTLSRELQDMRILEEIGGQAYLTGLGKTSWLLTVALSVARRGARVALFTMEMGIEQMVQRLISMETGIRIQQLRTADITPRQHTRFTEAIGRIANLPLFIDDTPAITPMEMRTKCRRLQHEYGLDVVMVDYMQLMSAGRAYENNRVQEISYISRSLKELARELNVTMLSTAQLSRAVEQRQDKRPQLSDLRESGSIEQDADAVMFLYRDEVYNPETTEFPNQADVLLSKHRHGPTGTIQLYFEKTITKFMDVNMQQVDLSDMDAPMKTHRNHNGKQKSNWNEADL